MPKFLTHPKKKKFFQQRREPHHSIPLAQPIQEGDHSRELPTWGEQQKYNFKQKNRTETGSGKIHLSFPNGGMRGKQSTGCCSFSESVRFSFSFFLFLLLFLVFWDLFCPYLVYFVVLIFVCFFLFVCFSFLFVFLFVCLFLSVSLCVFLVRGMVTFCGL